MKTVLSAFQVELGEVRATLQAREGEMREALTTLKGRDEEIEDLKTQVSIWFLALCHVHA